MMLCAFYSVHTPKSTTESNEEEKKDFNLGKYNIVCDRGNCTSKNWSTLCQYLAF